MSQLARDTGLTREGLYKALSADGNPSFGTVLRVADAMGYRFSLVSKSTKRATKASERTATASAASRARSEKMGARMR